MAVSAPSIVLITGATGHIGFRTLVYALTSGYTVRAAVRSQAKANLISSHPEIRSIHPGSRLTFTIIPDISAPNAYNEAVRGISYIIHIASPLNTGKELPLNQHEAFFVEPAVRGTLGILAAAHKRGGVRRVVITSSITALVPIEQMTGDECSSRRILPTDRIPFVPGPYASEFEAYSASKVAALEAAESWVRDNEPSFDVIHLHPSYVEGRNELAAWPREALKGTNALILGIVLGKHFGSMAGATVHNDDVARTHVQALDPIVPGNASYILSQPTVWDEVKDIVWREFPEAVSKGSLPNSGSADTHWLSVDTSLTENTFGFTHMGFEEQVVSVVGHYLELRAKQKASAKSSKRR